MYNGTVDLWTLLIADVFNQPITSNADIFSNDISLNFPAVINDDLATFTFEVTFNADGIFYFVIKDGGVEKIVQVNKGEVIKANSGGTYNITLGKSRTLNARFTNNATINYMTITAHHGKF